MKLLTRLIIQPASNGFIVTLEDDDKDETFIFSKRRQLMLFIGQHIDRLSLLEGEIS